MQANVRDLEAADLPAIRVILETWMRDQPGGPIRTDNVHQALQRMIGSIGSDGSTKYLVVEDGDRSIVGVGGFSTADIAVAGTPIGRSAELVNVYVSEQHRGKGFGRALVDHLEDRLRTLGCVQVIVVSGSRNRAFGYPFWDRRYGVRHRTDANFFGPGTERVVWVSRLDAD